jgi:hypothetical protein
MPISFNHNYGGFALDCNNHRGVDLVSDGKTLAMRWDHHSFLMNGFAVTELKVEERVQESSLGRHYNRAPTGRIVHLHLSSVGPVKVGPASALNNLFLNADDLSVDELLKLAYQKIDSRAEAEDNININPTEVSI